MGCDSRSIEGRQALVVERPLLGAHADSVVLVDGVEHRAYVLQERPGLRVRDRLLTQDGFYVEDGRGEVEVHHGNEKTGDHGTERPDAQ